LKEIFCKIQSDFAESHFYSQFSMSFVSWVYFMDFVMSDCSSCGYFKYCV